MSETRPQTFEQLREVIANELNKAGLGFGSSEGFSFLLMPHVEAFIETAQAALRLDQARAQGEEAANKRWMEPMTCGHAICFQRFQHKVGDAECTPICTICQIDEAVREGERREAVAQAATRAVQASLEAQAIETRRVAAREKALWETLQTISERIPHKMLPSDSGLKHAEDCPRCELRSILEQTETCAAPTAEAEKPESS